MSIEWMYHRNNCETCAKAQEFLGRKNVKPEEVVDARKVRFDKAEAVKLARKSDTIFSTKGQKVIQLDLKTGSASDDEIAALIMGPSGNLRAPAFRSGKNLMVGFNADTYESLLS
jgi:arsenate reductase-like glutaredoxin family protein